MSTESPSPMSKRIWRGDRFTPGLLLHRRALVALSVVVRESTVTNVRELESKSSNWDPNTGIIIEDTPTSSVNLISYGNEVLTAPNDWLTAFLSYLTYFLPIYNIKQNLQKYTAFFVLNSLFVLGLRFLGNRPGGRPRNTFLVHPPLCTGEGDNTLSCFEKLQLEMWFKSRSRIRKM